jgi:NAD-dependent SIR2 family protein deacetylase
MSADRITSDPRLQQAAEAIAAAEALLLGAGAGMGVDSGLPDFRGNQGFWRAYPPYQQLGLSFTSLANPRWFRDDPTLAWGFYGHRLELYRRTEPHDGFRILCDWAGRMKYGAFVYTSNVDDHFQKAGFPAERVFEVHGSIAWMQCTRRCGAGIFPAADVRIEIDDATMRAAEPLPRCPVCAALARPNILMFNDWEWDESRSAEQQERLQDWLGTVNLNRLVIVECGAGTAIPTVRHFCERLAAAADAQLIRINRRESEVPEGQLGLDLGALEALTAIQRMAEHLPHTGEDGGAN